MEAEAGSMAGAEVEPDPVLIQVRVPDIGLEKCLHFPQEERVYDVKQQILAAMPKVRHNQFIIFLSPKKKRQDKFSPVKIIETRGPENAHWHRQVTVV